MDFEDNIYRLNKVQNLVDWVPWGRNIIDQAKKSNKLIFIHIGYSACHWCEVMEYESFNTKEVSKLMNDNFICTKVDKEERPDLDNLYMDVAHLTTGRGGWPLNILCLPDGRPFIACSYFPKRQWINLINEVISLYKNEFQNLDKAASQIKSGIESMDFVGPVKDSVIFTEDHLKVTIEKWKKRLDKEFGGRKGGNKNLLPVELNFFLSYLSKVDDTELDKYVDTTLEKIAIGGCYDHLSGGFYTLSKDKFWHIPQFEKHLSDMGQMVEVYSKAYRLKRNKLYKNVVDKTINLCETIYISPDGLYYSSANAETNIKSGNFYAWTKQQILDTLKDVDGDLFCKIYNISDKGNYCNGSNVLYLSKPIDEIADELNIDLSTLSDFCDRCCNILKKERLKRSYPDMSNKCVVSCNATMIKGLVQAYKAFEDNNYLKIALRLSNVIKQVALNENGGLHRTIKNGKSHINAFLDDYALLADAWIDLYQVTFDQQWIDYANLIVEYARAHFFNEDNQLFYYVSVLDEPLLVRKSEMQDGALPASNSVMAINLYRLSKYYLSKEQYHTALQMLKNVALRIDKDYMAYANWERLKLYYIFGTNELVISGSEIEKEHKELLTTFMPFVFLASSNNNIPISEGKIDNDKKYFLCDDNECQNSTSKLDEITKQLLKKS